jgi:putative amino-acid transport system permease protein
MQFDLEFMLTVFPQIAKYIYVTLSISIISAIFGIALGLLLAIITKNKIKVLYPLAGIYISFFRGTPLLVQLFIFYYGLPQLIPQLSIINGYTATAIGLSLKNSAYFSEAIRGAITSVDAGQLEACLSVGMTKWQGMRRIVLPQATRVAIPSLANVYITLLKDTSLAFTLGVTEMLAQAKMIAADTFRFFECFLAVGIAYWIITIIFGFIQGWLEERLSRPYGQEAR